jgi:hypothetical protein
LCPEENLTSHDRYQARLEAWELEKGLTCIRAVNFHGFEMPTQLYQIALDLCALLCRPLQLLTKVLILGLCNLILVLKSDDSGALQWFGTKSVKLETDKTVTQCTPKRRRAGRVNRD